MFDRDFDAAMCVDAMENVLAARSFGMKAYQFRDSPTLLGELQRDGLL